MTRICCWCGAVLGEKCAECGGPVARVGETLAGEAFYRCGPCNTQNPAGDGGVTHGICEPCKAGVPPVLNMMLPPEVLE